MDCGLCSGYLAYSHKLLKKKGITHCTGCRPRNKQCAFIIRDCTLLREKRIGFCFECPDFPCRNIRHIDNRYEIKYGMSFIENLILIKEKGFEEIKVIGDYAYEWGTYRGKYQSVKEIKG